MTTTKEIMTKNPTTVQGSDSVAHAIDMLQTMQVRHLPVVDARGVLVGILSDRDLGSLMRTAFIESAESDRMTFPPEKQTVADFMSTDPLAAHEDADVLDVVDTMLDERVGAVPVVDDADRVVGIVSYVDVLEAVYRPEASAEEGPRPRAAPAARRPTPRGTH